MIPTTTKPVLTAVLGRASQPHSIFPELIVPAGIVDLTPEFAQRQGAYWQVGMEKVPLTCDSYLQVQASMTLRMALIHAQEKESHTPLAAAQQNLTSAL